jgi:hypothetical protein
LSIEQIKVENLREALRLLQRCIVTALATSLSLLLLETAAPSGPPQTIQFPGLFVGLNSGVAQLIFFAAYIVASLVAYSTIAHAKSIARSIADHETRIAALTYPTITTMTDRSLTGFSIALPPILFLIAAGIYVHGIWPLTDNQGTAAFMALLFGIMPYVGIYAQWRSGFDS